MTETRPALTRLELLDRLADAILEIDRPHPIRVAIDGLDASGKTILADELTKLVEDRGRVVLRASLDGFHRPRQERYHRGKDSPEGYYEDSFDYPALLDALLFPLGPGGDLRYRKAVFDHRSDERVRTAPRLASPDSILLMDGIFLFRPDLSPHWDFRIYVQVSIEESLRRGVLRDATGSRSAEVVRSRYLTRYLPGQQIYHESVNPQQLADAIVLNDDPLQPGLILKK